MTLFNEEQKWPCGLEPEKVSAHPMETAGEWSPDSEVEDLCSKAEACAMWGDSDGRMIDWSLVYQLLCMFPQPYVICLFGIYPTRVKRAGFNALQKGCFLIVILPE